MNHAHIRAFHAVATEGGFTKAARLLGVSQPAVTIQVKALEESYGASLLHRSGQTVSLSDLGRGLYSITRRIFDLEEEAEELLAAARELRGGHLRAGADGPYFVMGLLASFIGRYPRVRVTVAMGNSRSVLRDLVEYRTDVAVVARIDDDRRFHAVSLTSQPVVLFMPRNHPWAKRCGIRLAELEGQPMILREEGSSTRQIIEDALAEAGVAPQVVMEIGSREALHEAVAAGLGIGVVSAAELGTDDRLTVVKISDT
ncbi:MAG: LysR substrate-binding domain-containing protein, partial [Pseudomonadota bacterium]|nr:LysR substrate-binding domain-containing protein [Pseudomonadota bacterium]